VAARIEVGDIAVIDQLDLDLVSAQALVAARPAAVVNVRSSLSGRHPALGAAAVVESGIPLVDDVGPGLLSVVRDGQTVRLHDGSLYDAKTMLGHGAVRERPDVEAAQTRARVGMAGRLEAVGADMAGYLRAHEGLLLEGVGLPPVQLKIKGRPVLIVPPGERAATEVRALRAWVRERRPVVISADAGAESAVAARVRPDLVIGPPGSAKTWWSWPVPRRPMTSSWTVIERQRPPCSPCGFGPVTGWSTQRRSRLCNVPRSHWSALCA